MIAVPAAIRKDFPAVNDPIRGGLAALDPCVHCGFCLQACPTYLATGDEADGPRGRITLMRAMEAGVIGADDPILRHHLDRCLGCRGCEPVCPSGVGYGAALETARARIARASGGPTRARALARVFSEPLLRRPLLGASRWIRGLVSRIPWPSPVRFPLAMLAATRPRSPARAARRATEGIPVQLFRGCVMDDLFRHVHQATVRVLEQNGYRVVDPPGQGCCGALFVHAGVPTQARGLAAANVRAFVTMSDAPIAANSAGCGAQLRSYADLLDGSAEAVALAERAVDVSQLLEARGPRRGAALGLQVAYDPPCHLLHAQGVADAPIALLRAIPGLDLVPLSDAEQCCGAAGLYALTQRDLSQMVLQAKVERIREAAPDVVVTGNPGCIMQLGAGLRGARLDIPVRHPVELLDDSYARAGYY